MSAPFAFGPGSALSTLARLRWLLALVLDELSSCKRTSLLGALHIVAARFGHTEHDVDAVLTLLDCAPDLIGYHARARVIAAWECLRRAA